MLNKYIELNAFLKLKGLASTGGQAKILIRSGEVVVNREKETRNKRKLSAGDKVSYQGNIYLVEQEMLKMG
ncbi:RNA-binding S4 domain-containing protein [Candidatus Woesearchaeota archaeon]|nr:RNA-binding S4 domain-containing protein [Candidatus Woesearchaeota archaeon]